VECLPVPSTDTLANYTFEEHDLTSLMVLYDHANMVEFGPCKALDQLGFKLQAAEQEDIACLCGLKKLLICDLTDFPEVARRSQRSRNVIGGYHILGNYSHPGGLLLPTAYFKHELFRPVDYWNSDNE